jgi:hypothetical protein
VRNFDRIVVLQAGRVMQDGPPDLLVRREGLYRQLVQREMDRLAQAAASANPVLQNCIDEACPDPLAGLPRAEQRRRRISGNAAESLA